jgi:tRNA 2-thiouridine synthesizing protein A
VIEVIATDPSTERDITKFCTFLGHTLLEQQQQGEVFTFFIEKA